MDKQRLPAKQKLSTPQNNSQTPAQEEISLQATNIQGILSTTGQHLNPQQTIKPNQVIELQRLIGNQAVMRMLNNHTAQSHNLMRKPSDATRDLHTDTVQRTSLAAIMPGITTMRITLAIIRRVIRAVAASLVDIEGTATAADKEVVVDEMVKIPLVALMALRENNIRVVVCRNSVTEVRTDLQGVRPRGWPAGRTWDTVPGLFDSSNSRVIIATRNGAVPATGDGHGAHNLVLHEVGHAIGESVEQGGEDDPDFIAARNRDRARLDNYEGQAGHAGVEETYAESFARFYGGDPDDATNYPNLHAYWASNPFVGGSD